MIFKPAVKTSDKKKNHYIFYFLLFLSGHSIAYSQDWISQGSAPSRDGQVEGIAGKEIGGAVKCIAAHPLNADSLFIGAVNGGVWRTMNARAVSPTWQFVSAGFSSQAIGALEFDPTDNTHRTLVAGLGRFSSFYHGAGKFGIFRTTTGGDDWIDVDQNQVFANVSITGIAARGNVMIAASADGIFRTEDTGIRWTKISGATLSGLPEGSSYDLAADPNNQTVFYTNAGNRGIFKTSDMGLTWRKVSDPLMDMSMSSVSNLKIAIGNNNNIFVAVVENGRLKDIFKSGNGGTDWIGLDLPQTIEGRTKHGIHTGGQGDIHLSLAADPANSFIVYIGGDRQPWKNEPQLPVIFPNSMGAMDFSGRLFRIDGSLANGNQVTPLTHTGTNHNSAPHADSRDMTFDADGNLLETSDGGIYKRTRPTSNSGDWLSLNSNLNATEAHSVDWDANANIVISGVQDNGTPQQETPAEQKWKSISTGDGGDVAVDDISSAAVSIRYSSFNQLSGFRKTKWLANNTFVSEVYPTLMDVVTRRPINGFAFVAPIKINSQRGSRLLIASTTGLYESLDEGSTVRKVGAFRVNADGRDALAYGTADNVDIIYAGVNATVRIRKTAAGQFTNSTHYPGENVEGISINPLHANEAFVTDGRNIYHTITTGDTWADITSNISTWHAGNIRSIAFISLINGTERVAIGTDAGVFTATAPDFNNWVPLGRSLPNVSVFDLDFDQQDQILVAGTMGLGTWTFQF